jgi:UDP-N-acetylglucosamine 2-epimerase (non-hydrolysing)
VAAKAQIPIAHVEAGLRSFDRAMPEEINRMVTDRLADLLLTPSEDGDENLLKEGVPRERIFRVGNVMIDTLLTSVAAARKRPLIQQLGLKPGGYAVCTLHRPSNVDDPATLSRLLGALDRVQKWLPVVFPIHPRTRKNLEASGHRLEAMPQLRTVEPLGYLDFLCLTSQAQLCLTDSGGLQEETTALGIPCLTLRENTERPITVTQGTNRVVGTDPDRIVAETRAILDGRGKAGRQPEGWDGKAAERIAAVYADFLLTRARRGASETAPGTAKG